QSAGSPRADSGRPSACAPGRSSGCSDRQFLIRTPSFALPVLPALSRTVALSVCVPLRNALVFHAIDTGAVLVVLAVATVWPSSCSVYVYDAPVVPSYRPIMSLCATLTVY